MLDGLIHPVHAADSGRTVVPDIFRHLRISIAVIGIGLVHIQGLAHQEQFPVPVFCQGLQGHIIHHIVVESPAAGSLIAHVPQIFFGQVVLHAELGRIFPVFIGIVAAGSIDEIAFITGLLQAPEEGRLFVSRQILVIDQLGPEGGIEPLGGRHSGGIVMIDPGIFLEQGIQIRSGIRRDIGIVVMEIIPMDTFQDQHHHPVIGRPFPGNSLGFGQNPQFCQSCLVLLRQSPFLVFPGIMDYLIRLEEGFLEKVHIDGISHHGPGGLPALFHIYFDIQPAYIVRRMVDTLRQQQIRPIEPHSQDHYTEQGPRQIGFMPPGTADPEQRDEGQQHGANQAQLPVFRGAEDSLGSIDVQVVEQDTFHMHRGVPEIDPIPQDQDAGHIIDQEIDSLQDPVGPVVVAHGCQEHQHDVVEEPGQYRKSRHKAWIQLQVGHHEQGIRQIQDPCDHHGEIPFHPVPDAPPLGVQEKDHPGKEQVPAEIVQGMVPEFSPGKGHDLFQKIPAVIGFRCKTQEQDHSVNHFLLHKQPLRK